MLLKILLKIWPSLTPILAYIFWVYIVERLIIRRLLKKSFVINAKKSSTAKKNEYEIKKVGVFSLRNKNFVIILYISLILAIVTMINFGL